jgi:hypothetical protein
MRKAMFKRRTVLLGLMLTVMAVAIWSQVTIFVIQPIGAVPDGRTLVMSRLKGTTFIDSADAMCERIQGNVNLLCRGIVLGQVGQNADVYLRLPYSASLYSISTGGKTYDR